MTTLYIYKRNELTLEFEAKWVDGDWVVDPDNKYSSIPHIDEYSEEMIIDRFDGPYKFCAREEDMSEVLAEFDLEEEMNPVAYRDGAGGLYWEMADTAKDLAAGELDTDLYPEEVLTKLRNHPAYENYDG